MRPVRFPLQLHLRYRGIGEQTWKHGVTENISRRGVLFQAVDLPPVSSRLELTFRLRFGPFTSEVRCRAEVLRTEAVENRGTVAARIDDYRIRRV